MQENLADLGALLDRVFPELASDMLRWRAAFGDTLFLHLSRQEKLAQAVLRVKAEQTGLWHIASDGSEIERTAPPRLPEYDFDDIHEVLQRLEAADAAWERWFDVQGVDPLRISYEVLSADPAGVLASVCTGLGTAPPDPGTVHPHVARLSDATSTEWISRYRHDIAVRG